LLLLLNKHIGDFAYEKNPLWNLCCFASRQNLQQLATITIGLCCCGLVKQLSPTQPVFLPNYLRQKGRLLYGEGLFHPEHPMKH
jgi:hypothetical protein